MAERAGTQLADCRRAGVFEIGRQAFQQPVAVPKKHLAILPALDLGDRFRRVLQALAADSIHCVRLQTRALFLVEREVVIFALLTT